MIVNFTGNQQLETKLRSRKVEGVAIWIDNMFLRVGFRLPGSSGSVTRAQILSAGHSPTKAPAVLKVNVSNTELGFYSCSVPFAQNFKK